MAARFGGFTAISLMTWQEYALARQLLVEERIGTRIRESQANEDAQASANAKAIQRGR